VKVNNRPRIRSVHPDPAPTRRSKGDAIVLDFASASGEFTPHLTNVDPLDDYIDTTVVIIMYLVFRLYRPSDRPVH
jgi:hypothetical protein